MIKVSSVLVGFWVDWKVVAPRKSECYVGSRDCQSQHLSDDHGLYADGHNGKRRD